MDRILNLRCHNSPHQTKKLVPDGGGGTVSILGLTDYSGKDTLATKGAHTIIDWHVDAGFTPNTGDGLGNDCATHEFNVYVDCPALPPADGAATNATYAPWATIGTYKRTETYIFGVPGSDPAVTDCGGGRMTNQD